MLGSVTVDPRAGSEKLIAPLRALGLKVETDRMDYGDISFLANLQQGVVPIGIEMKTLGDVLSCIGDGRFAGHQLPGLLDTYGVVVLLLQGQYKRGHRGELLIKKKRWTAFNPSGMKVWEYSRLSGWLWSIRMAGVTVMEVADLQESAAAIHALYTWGSKPWEAHKTLKVLHTPPDRVSQVQPTRLKRMAACIQGIGWERAGAVADFFKTPARMATADEEQWCEIPGVDKVLSKRAVRTMQTSGVK